MPFRNIYIVFTYTVIIISCSNQKQITESERVHLKQQLLDMVESDQIAANPPKNNYQSLSSEEWEALKDSIFTSNKERLESIYNQYGFLGFDKVGKEGATHFWLLVQHCDEFPKFQQLILKDMEKEVRKENANAKDFAYLFDRVAANAKKKQKFGTQVDYDIATTGRAFPKFGLIDSANVDSLRIQHGLSPLKDYLNMMTTLQYEMNKVRYNEKGIHAPNLYD